MRRRLFAGITAIALTGSSVVGFAAPAQAAGPVLYVRPLTTVCSDTGPGTQEQPFCTLNAAAAVVTAGQTVEAATGDYYRQNLTVTSSGTPDQPITFRAAPGAFVTLSGPGSAINIDGQHDIRIEHLKVNSSTEISPLDIRHSSAITIVGGGFFAVTPAPAPAVRLTGVTASTLKGTTVGGRVAGVVMDAATSGVTIDAASVGGSSTDDGAPGAGVVIDGHGNRVVNSTFDRWRKAAILVTAGATDTLLVNNQVNGGPGVGIHNNGAARTTITNNTVQQRCTDGIRIDGPSSGVSVHNNFLEDNGSYHPNLCLGVVADGADLGIYDGGVGSTVADYNNILRRSGSLAYAWNGTRMTLAGFRAASGQAANDRSIVNLRDNYDSANSAAPGYPATDRVGAARVDDPAVPNTGAGPVTYADRGSTETARLPVPRTNVALDLAAMSVKVDASASEPGIVPIASYEFSFGDGTVVKQTSPLVTYRYGRTGQYSVRTTAIGTDGRSASRADFVELLPVTATMGLLSRPLLKYVGASGTQTVLDVSQASLSADARFDLADAGSGQVALLHKGFGKYVSVGGIDGAWMQPNALSAGNAARFTLIRNADGSISLKSVSNGRYVSLYALDTPVLAVNGTAIDASQKFYQVKTSDAGRSFKASANGLFVSAQQAGAQPLKATARIAQSWERFDIIDLGGGKVALFAQINSKLVAAEGAGTKPLLAGRVAVSTWETFTLIRNSDGTVSFRAAANNLYVSAERAGAQPLIASRPAINTWEKYTIF